MCMCMYSHVTLTHLVQWEAKKVAIDTRSIDSGKGGCERVKRERERERERESSAYIKLSTSNHYVLAHTWAASLQVVPASEHRHPT